MTEKVVFLDRDGVISEELGDGRYISRWDQFRFIPGSLRALRLLTEGGLNLFVISNQAGVGKKLMTQEQLDSITKRMLAGIEKGGGEIRGVYYCVHQPEENCRCRKPKVALFQKAVRGNSIAWETSVVVGDSMRDLEAGRQLGCRTVLVLSGKTRKEDTAGWPFQPDHAAKDLLRAVPWILGYS